ncbi:MAG: flagellar hook assembly protein FlgD [Desulfobulbaceae bacterium]|nr:flagellar hook assembly protein FlgD [Desulfobulbaceae bacterium]
MSSYTDAINQAANVSAVKSKTESTGETSMGKEDFLSLLVAQLQNQDPLNPDDPTEFTAQLAQFSSLEQLFTLNESMDNLVNSNAASDKISTLSTIGKTVAYQGGSFEFSGEPVEVGYQLDGAASEVTILLQKNNDTVATLEGTELTAGNHYITWDGLTADGDSAPTGEYTIVLQAKAVEGGSVETLPLVKSEVTGVDLGGQSGGTLITNAGEISFNSILGVYEPGSKSASVESEKEQASLKESIDESTAAIEKVTDDAIELTE